MAKSAKRSKGTPKKAAAKPAPNPAVRMWIVRGVVGVLLLGLVSLALLDFRTKQDVSATAAGWREALKSKGEMKDLTKSEFKKLPVTGQPTITSFQSATRSMTENSSDTYSWKGIFRTYSVKVAFGLGNDPSVETIDGP